MALPDPVHATVVYCRPDRQWELPVVLPAGASLLDAVRASGLLAEAPELQGAALDLGIFNRAWPATTPVRAGDRIEVYRPLQIDPKEARRLRAQLRARRDP